MSVSDLDQVATRARATRWLTWIIGLVGIGAVIGLAVLWPTGDAPDLGTQPRTYVDATVRDVDTASCDSIEVPGALSGCRRITVELTSGDRAGDEAVVVVFDTQFDVPEIEVGDELVLLDTPSSPGDFRYSFTDFQRGIPLAALAIIFAVVVIAFGRTKGIRALLGLAASAAVLVVFIVPALLRDGPSLPVALVGTTVIAFLALYLAHGVNTGTTVALAGTLLSLGVIALLATVTSQVAHLSGLAEEESQVLSVTAGAVDLRGLLIAGIIVGALGVLDDVTVTQVSTVRALLRARPDIPRRTLYTEATHVGRDHIASTVNTLVLAYAGAALPLLLFFAEGAFPISRNLTTEVVAVEIARMLIGSIGLVLSVPITTAIAAALLDPSDDPDAHAHH